MTWLITTAISNAAIATILGLIAYVAGRRAKSAAVGHAVWVLVLVKLVTPPVLDLPLPVLPPRFASTEVVSIEQPPTELRMPNVTPVQVASSTSADLAPAAAEPAFSFSLQSIVPWLLRIWLAGAVIYGAYQIYVTWQMCKLMKLAAPDCRIDRAMHRIARRAKVTNYPTARVVPWVGSPMLWGLGGTSVIVLPEQLFDTIDDQAADTLMQHELAHFHRGDQWIRILEVVASTVFWWHPIVWLAMREIEVYEEQCCDAWVVQQDRSNRRRYAEALLDTVDFISDTPDSARPIGASGLGRVPLLQRRLKAIMQGDRQALSSRSRLGLACLLALVPLQPKLLQANFLQPVPAPTVPTVPELEPERLEIDPLAEFVNGVKQYRDQSLAEKIRSRSPVPKIEYAIADSVYGTYQLVASSGYRVQLKEVITGNVVELTDYRIACAAFVPPQEQTPVFAAGCADGAVHLFGCTTGESIDLLAKFEGVIHSVAYSRSGERLAVGGDEGIVHIINLIDRSVRSFEQSFGPVRSVRFSADGSKLAVATDTTWRAGEPGRVDIWSVETATRELTIQCPTAVGVAGFHSSGNLLTAEWNGVLRTWSAAGRHLFAREKSKDSISAAAFSPNAISLETLSEMQAIPN